MKTTFSHFPGMFEKPAPAKYYLKKLKYYELLTNTNESKNNRRLLVVISE